MSNRARRIATSVFAFGVAGLVTLASVPAKAGGVRIRLRVPSTGEKKEVIRERVEPWKSQLAYCYSDMPEEDLRFQHRMRVIGMIDEGAALMEPKIEGKLEDELVQECLERTIASMRFDGLENETITFEIRFNQH